MLSRKLFLPGAMTESTFEFKCTTVQTAIARFACLCQRRGCPLYRCITAAGCMLATIRSRCVAKRALCRSDQINAHITCTGPRRCGTSSNTPCVSNMVYYNCDHSRRSSSFLAALNSSVHASMHLVWDLLFHVLVYVAPPQHQQRLS